MKNSNLIFRRPVGIAVALVALSLTLASAMASPSALSGAQLEELLVAATSDASQRCSINYLKSLGWTIVPSVSGKVEISGGEVCQEDSIAAVKAAGGLTIGLPTDVSSSELLQLVAQLPEIVNGRATRCAYKQKVAIAAKSALGKIQANDKFVFTKKFLPLGFVDLGFRGGVRMGWKKKAARGLLYEPRKSNSDSIESFYTQKAHLECAAGLQLAEYAIQYELYGRKDFDQAFTHSELSLGNWDQVNESDSATHGQNQGTIVEDPEAVKSASLGGQALVARTGYLGNVFGESFLDAPDDRGENLMIVSLNKDASQSIVAAGGLAKFNAEMRRVWDLHTSIKNDQKWLEKKRHKDSEIAAVETRIQVASDEIEKIYASDALFTQLQTYTHPFKEMKTFKEQSDRLFELNPRTPYSLALYEDVINEGLFERHSKYMVSQCMKIQGAIPAPILRPNPIAVMAPDSGKAVAAVIKAEAATTSLPSSLQPVVVAPLVASIIEPDPVSVDAPEEKTGIAASTLKSLSDYAAGIAARLFK